MPTSIHYYHFDGLGSVIALTNSSGSVVNLYEYSVYGEVSASDPNHPNRFLFTGREFDKDTGLYYYRARYYNPYIGRFLQTDPIGYGGGMNRYAYCHNSAINAIDPLGLRDRRCYGYWRDIAVNRNTRNTDSKEKHHYYGQNANFNCAAIALANLHVASGKDAMDHVAEEIRCTYPAANWPGVDLALSCMSFYFQDYLEVETGVVSSWDDNTPSYMVPFDKDWNASGIDTLAPVERIVEAVGATGSYRYVENLTGRLLITEAIKPPELGGRGKPVIVAFRVSNVNPEEQVWNVRHHVVVVRYCEGAESYDEVKKEWVPTPYEIVDGQVGNYDQFYLTSKEFMELVDEAGAEAVIPY